MILEEQPRRGPSQTMPGSQLFAQPLTEYQVAIVSSYASPPSLNSNYMEFLSWYDLVRG